VQTLKSFGRVGSFLTEVSQFYLNFYSTRGGLSDAMHVHDSSAIMALLCARVFTHSVEARVYVECASVQLRGLTTAEWRPAVASADTATSKNVTVLLEVRNGCLFDH
jgi:inosine-uridine nucleoside N-ribohydrolase